MGTTIKGQIIKEKRGKSLLLSLRSRNGARWQACLDPDLLRQAIGQAEGNKVEVILSIDDDGQVELYLTPIRVSDSFPPISRKN